MTTDMLELYVWPGKWDLPSIDPQCLAAILYLQLCCPGRFKIVECSNPDLSPSGQLPFLVHDKVHKLSPLPVIVSWLSRRQPSELVQFNEEQEERLPPFRPSLDTDLPIHKNAQITAWRSYVDLHIGDLVANSFYALSLNYHTLTAPTLISTLPIPQAYWMPNRIRQTWKARLEAAGLWDYAEEKEVGPPVSSWTLKKSIDEVAEGSERVRKAFGREKILEKAKTSFDLVASLVKPHSFIYSTVQEGPSSIDIHLAAHLLIILNAPLPNPLLKTLLLESYPTLIDHALLVRAFAFPAESVTLNSPSESYVVLPDSPSERVRRPHPDVIPLAPLGTQTTFRLVKEGMGRLVEDIIPWQFGKSTPTPQTQTAPSTSAPKDQDKPEDDDPAAEMQKSIEKKMRVGRWVWYLVAGVGAVAYTFGSGLLRVEFVETEDGSDEGEDEEDEEEMEDGEEEEEDD